MKIKGALSSVIILLLPMHVDAIIQSDIKTELAEPVKFDKPRTTEDFNIDEDLAILIRRYMPSGREPLNKRIFKEVIDDRYPQTPDESEPTPDTIEQESQEETEEEDEPEYTTEIYGYIEAAYSRTQGDDGDYESHDLYGSLEISLRPNDRLELYTSLLQDINEDLHLDEAILVWHALHDSRLDILFGRQALPFGVYDSNMFTFPLTYDLGYINLDKVIRATSQLDQLELSAYIFKGRSEKPDETGDHKDGFGLSAGYFSDNFEIGAGFLSNLAESDEAFTHDVAEKIPAVAINGSLKIDDVVLIAEHIAAIKHFQTDDLDEEITEAARPSATHLEASFILPNAAILTTMWTETNEAEELGLSKSIYGATYSQQIYKSVFGSIEIVRDRDYDGLDETILSISITLDFEAYY